MSAEFDQYADRYHELLKDPIRDRFAADTSFFHLRKWILLRSYLERERLAMKDMRWLDVGCGKGELLQLGSGHFKEAVGCDPSTQMLGHTGNIKVEHQPDPAVLPFGGGAFDLVTAVCVYHHLAPAARDSFTSEIGRVLRPGGLAAIFEHNPWNPLTRLIVSRTPVDDNAILLPAPEARQLFQDAGLRPLRTVYYLYLPQALFTKFGAIESWLTRIPAGGQYVVFGRAPAAG